ncbi:MAG: FAD-dependent oxidoreductase, partial [Candidatus Nanosynbacter sp.]|nr:FAD-dependent oxidoreductase [Candidatus Nanosynbacter sp.]
RRSNLYRQIRHSRHRHHPRRLNLINESELIGHGISYCATCDGAFYQNQTVAVVGGGNSALLAASYLSHIAQKVFLIHRRSHFTAEKALVSQIKNSANIEILYNQEILACHANEDNHLDSLILKNQQVIPVSSLFVEIGRLSSLTEIFQNSNLRSLLLFDQSGFIITDDTCSTNLAGLFAAGDCRSKNFRQLVTASSDGAIAANSAIEFLSQV